MYQSTRKRWLVGAAPALCATAAVAYVLSPPFHNKSHRLTKVASHAPQSYTHVEPDQRHVTLHRTVSDNPPTSPGPAASTPAPHGVLVVGDVHGCLKELRWLHDVAVKEHNGGRPLERVVLVGDLVNKGPSSAAVVQYVRSQHPYMMAVRGNHDHGALLAALGDPRQRGKAKYAWIQDLDEEDVEFLRQLPFSIRIPKGHWESLERDILVVHAGLVPGIPLEDQTNDIMMTIRDVEPIYNENKEFVRYEGHSGRSTLAWAKAWKGPEHVVFGHDAIRKLQQEKFATGLDTGACYGFELTGLLLPERKLIKVSSLEEYCPVGKPGC